MDNDFLEETCNCPIECNSISYSFTLESSELNPEEVCPDLYRDGFDFDNLLMKPFYQHKSPSQFVRKLMKIQTNVSDEAVDYCKQNLKYRAEVIFRLATNSMSVTVLSSRLSFFDKMSSFGK